MNKIKKIVTFVAMFGWLCFAVLLFIGGAKHEQDTKMLNAEIEVLTNENRKREREKTNDAYAYEQKISSLKGKIDELYGEMNAQQGVIDELKLECQELRLFYEEHKSTATDAESGGEWVVKAASVSIDENGNEFYMIDSEISEMAIKPDPNPVPEGNDHLTKAGGVYWFRDHTETYYNLDMSVVVQVAHSRGIDGDYHVRSDGAKMLGDYIMVAACYYVHPYGSLVETSLGMGIVVDTGAFTSWNAGNIDIATTW